MHLETLDHRGPVDIGHRPDDEHGHHLVGVHDGLHTVGPGLEPGVRLVVAHRNLELECRANHALGGEDGADVLSGRPRWDLDRHVLPGLDGHRAGRGVVGVEGGADETAKVGASADHGDPGEDHQPDRGCDLAHPNPRRRLFRHRFVCHFVRSR